MKNEYYIPQIEEFHVGFKFEFRPWDWRNKKYIDLWKSKVFMTLGSLSRFEDKFIKDEVVRVKYLVREGIESLGFIYEDKNEVYTYNKTFRGLGTGDDKKCVLFYYEDKKEILIQLQENRGTIYVLFNGIIKNKSELKKLLTQLQII